MQINHDDVIQVIREASAKHILPLWKNLEDHHVDDKGGGDLVTAADRACELFLTEQLSKIVNRSLVVGEEAVSENAAALGALESDQAVWVVDPLDGTRNFANHRQPFGVMVALVKEGETLAGWIYDPLSESLLSAELGAGCLLDGQRVSLQAEDKSSDALRGAVLTGYLPQGLREYVKAQLEQFAEHRSFRCAAHDYRRLVTGEVDFLLYYRTCVWDHAPGVLIAEEAGAMAARYNGAAYSPRSKDAGLLCASTNGNWQTAKDLLIPARWEN